MLCRTGISQAPRLPRKHRHLPAKPAFGYLISARATGPRPTGRRLATRDVSRFSTGVRRKPVSPGPFAFVCPLPAPGSDLEAAGWSAFYGSRRFFRLPKGGISAFKLLLRHPASKQTNQDFNRNAWLKRWKAWQILLAFKPVGDFFEKVLSRPGA